MRIGIVVENNDWQFFRGTSKYLSQFHQITSFEPRTVNSPVFYGRLNNALYKHDLQAFIRANDVTFFEWAGEHLVSASQFAKQGTIVTRLHRYEMFFYAQRINWENVDRIIFVSHAMRKRFESLFPQFSSKSIVVHNGIDLQRFDTCKRPANCIRIGTLCNLVPRKRVYGLILAFGELCKQNEGFCLHIGGVPTHDYPEYLPALEGLIEKTGLQEKVTLDGWVSNTPEWFRNIDIFVSFSYMEGLQVALLEAMASGCFCLSHSWDGAEEALPPENLFGTATDFIRKVMTYAGFSNTEREHHKAAMRAIAVEKFDAVRMMQHIRGILESLRTDDTC